MALALVALSLALPIPITPDEGGNPYKWLPKQVRAEYGTFSQYNRGPTDSQIWYHTTVTKLLDAEKEYDGFIAVIDCEKVGGEAWVKLERGWWKHVFIFDCSGHVSTTRWMTENDILAELGWYIVEDAGFPHHKGLRGAITYQNPLR